ncbi:MAG: hypothetical protein AB7I50_07210 [Vicinamibacterales bacterium]
MARTKAREIAGRQTDDERYNTGPVPTAVSGAVDARSTRSAPPAHLLAPLMIALVVLFLTAAALNLDVVRTGFGIKGDEATYVSMAMSLAEDGDLAWDRGDLERFWSVYRTGPEGIFLKRAQSMRLQWSSSFPFVDVTHHPDMTGEPLYFGKAFAYAVVAAPFYRAAGLNGLLVLHVWLWGLCLYCGFMFLRARLPSGTALIWSVAFFGLSITPVYLVWLTPEILHVAAVFLAYYLCFSSEADSGSPGRPWTRRGVALWGAAVLLGLATFSKPPNLLLAGPPVILLWERRQWWSGLGFGLLAAATVVVCFGINGLISGDFNYQGGDRKTFYGTFPYSTPSARYDNTGISMSTNEIGSDEIRDSDGLVERTRLNAWYFLVGRHAGFIPYFFPAAALVACWAVARRRRALWEWAIVAAVVTTILVLIVALPYSWAGGGGPPGNRYFLSVYPVLLFLSPGSSALWPAIVAFSGGAVFLAHVLINPFVASKSPWQNAQRGLLRWLPVELTMVNDLPVMLNSSRARVPYGTSPVLLLYFLDDHTYQPEAAGLWVAGGQTSEVIVRTGEPLDRFTVTLRTTVPNRVRLSAGGEARDLTLNPGTTATASVPAVAVATRGSYAYLFRMSTTNGAVPALNEAKSSDPRYLGVFMDIRGHVAPAGPSR